MTFFSRRPLFFLPFFINFPPRHTLFLRNSSLQETSLHIFVYHCTFCASLHVKTSPVVHYIIIIMMTGSLGVGLIDDTVVMSSKT